MAAHGAGKPSTAFRIPAPPLTPPHSNPLAPTWTTVANPPPTPPVSRTGTGTVSRSATGTVLPLPPLTTAPRANTDPYAPEYTTPAPAAPATAGGLPPGYAAQILPGRYLRYQVIDAYVKQHPGASFGSAPLLRLLGPRRGYYTLIARRILTEDEIKMLERESYPQYYQTGAVF